MQNITYIKFTSHKLFLLFFLFFVTKEVKSQITNALVVTICKDGTGSLSVDAQVPKSVTVFSGHWNAATDPEALIPQMSMKNSTNCKFSKDVATNYTQTTFTVSVSGIYDFKMTDTENYDGAAYIYSGNFTPGKCGSGGIWIVGDDDWDGVEKEPHMKASLQAGVIYTLVSTLYWDDSRTFVGDYTWTITPPSGGKFFPERLNYWYTSASGGDPIGWGNTFNPVGVSGSGLSDTKTPGKTTYYVSDGFSAQRTPVDFVIINNNTATNVINPTITTNTPTSYITQTTTGATGIGTATGLPSGIVAKWENNQIIISGTPTISGTFNYKIPLTGGCGSVVARGSIEVMMPENQVCDGELATPIVNIDFGQGTNINSNGPSLASGETTYSYSPSGIFSIGSYGIRQNPQSGNNVWHSATDHTGNPFGYMMVVDANSRPDEFFKREITGLCPNTTYVFQAYVANIFPTDTYYCSNRQEPNLVFEVSNSASPSILQQQVISGIITPTSKATGMKWQLVTMTFKTNASQNGVILKIKNYNSNPETCGNDVAIDDITFSACVPIVYITSSSPEICSGKTFPLTASLASTGDYHYQWQKNNNGSWEDISGATSLQYTTPELYTTTEYRIRYAELDIDITNNNNLKCSGSKEITILVSPRAKADDITITSKSTCSNSKTTMTPKSAVGTTFYWYDDLTDNATLLGTGSSFTTEKLTASKTYYIAVSGENNCENSPEDRKAVTITITPKPEKITTTETICEDETYLWTVNNKEYTASGTYLTTNNACTADQELILTVTAKPSDIVTTETICSGETFNWNGTDYTTAQSGLRIANNGCTADQVLNLTITAKPSDIVTTETICSGETFKWNGTDYTTAQSGLRIANNGCTADQVLNLTITAKPSDIVTTETICSGETFNWNGTDYTTSQSGLRIANNGCTADQVLNLTVTAKPSDIITTKTICSGETFKWNGTDYTTAQSGLRIANNGCTADQVLNLTITAKPVDIVTTETICSGETFNWNGTDYTTSQSGLRIANNGCTADQVLNLTVTAKPSDIVTTEEICIGETFNWNGTDYTTTQSGLRIANNGCTADQVLNLTVTDKPVDIVTTETICSGQTYTWAVNNQEYITSGTYNVINNGCTADQRLVLIVTPKPANVITTQSICSGQTYTWAANNQGYTTSGTYNIVNDECTADQVLNLTVTAKPSDIVTTEEICIGETFNWNGTDYTTAQSGLRIANNGCTADQVLNLTITPKPVDIVTTETICSGQTYTWAVNNQEYITSGTYNVINNGCTADQRLVLTVTPKPANVITTQSICSGQTYTWAANNQEYTTSGTYNIVNDECTADQVLNLTVTAKPSDIVTTEEICIGETFKWNGTDYTTAQSGLRIANNGCTADQVLNLTITDKPSDIVTTETICSGETFNWNGTDYTTAQSGLRIANNGCTADQVLNLTITAKPVDIVTTETICSGETFKWNGTDYITAQSGLRIANNGCTADQVLNLTITPKPIDIVTTETICSGETFNWNGTDYTTAQSGLRIINNGCTADQVLNLTITAKPVDIATTETICSGETFNWNGTDYTTAQSGLRIANNGCTADQVLNLIITAKPVDIVTTETICSGETFNWNGTDYTTAQSGLRIVNNGCTADQVLNLTITPKPVDIVTTETICSGETFNWNGTDYTTAQSGLRIANNECTADQVLNLTVTAKPVDIVTTETICSGETFNWNGTDYTTAQSGLRIANNGCTADQVLNLTITAKPVDIVTTETICSGETFNWNGTDYTTAQSGLRIANNGCTADQVLNLTITAKPVDIVTTETICSGETFNWNGTDYTTAQSGLRIINNGCTADQILNLTVTPKPVDIITTKTICSGETFNWNGTDYTTAQSGLRIANNGCTADQVLNLTVTAKPSDIVTTKTICSGETFNWNGTDYTTAQSGLRIANNGCTADQVLNLTITAKPIDIVTTKAICSGETFNWNGTDYTTAQSGLRIANNGCTADQVLNLTIAQPLNASITPDSLLGETCANDKDGQFAIEINGGFAPYKAAVDNKNGNYTLISNTNYTFENLTGGLHTVYLKDALDCEFELEVSIPEPVIINPVAIVYYDCQNNLPANLVTVTIDSSITNPADVDYSLDGDPLSYQNSNVFTHVSPGTHFIRARHSNSCEKDTQEFTIDDVQPLKLKIENGGLNEILATAVGGDGKYLYSFEGESFSSNNKFIIYKTGTYTVVVTDSKGCSDTQTISANFIDVCIPNYFTPNGDGINDEWGPGCTEIYKNLTFNIFDRHGRLIAEYRLGQKWNGKYNETELPAGDYWYVLKLNDNKDNREFVGHFNLYR